jgi:microcystin degradation protein MlrC
MSLPTANKNSFRIALMGIYPESNSFAPGMTTIEHFKSGRYLKGESIIKEYQFAHHELGGAIEEFSKNNVTLLPVFYAETTPGGILSEKTFQQLLDEMWIELEKVLPIDACFVVPHGAGIAENFPDMDGRWLELLRIKLGNDTPIVGTLDPHSNISEKMVSVTQGLFPYSTNPHIDQRETGKKAARFLLDILQKKICPVQHLVQVPVAISIEQQHTEAEPCKSLYEFAKRLGISNNLLHVNIALGFPYGDVYEMGTAVIIITDRKGLAENAKQEVLSYFNSFKNSFVGDKEQFISILPKIEGSPKPVLLLDMGDNVGGGGSGDSTYILENLEKTGLKSIICIYDPEAVATCITYIKGQTFTLSIGKNPETYKAYKTRVTLKNTFSGIFSETEPRHGGQSHYNMGKTAVITTLNGNTVLLHSNRVPPFSLAQLTSCSINPKEYEVIIAKGVIAPMAAYGPVCPTIIKVNTPGLTTADMTQLSYHHRRKPLFPFEH